MNTYVVEGGIGKCTAFTSLIPKLKQKSEVQIYTPYIQCFANNPDVKLVLEQSLPLQDPRIMASDNIYYCEPYKSNFQFGKEHLIESYCNLHDVEFDVNMKPKLYTEHLKENVDKWLKDKEIDKYILIQFSGGQSPLTYDGNYNNINPNRNYQPFLAQQVINMLKEEYKDATIIDCTLPNEPAYMNTIKCDLHWSEVHELMKDALGFVSIDSCLNHFSASAEKHGVVIWGSTRWTQFGYSHNKNLQFHMKDKWDETKFIDSDPRNNMVEPKLIIDEYKKLDKNKPVACATILNNKETIMEDETRNAEQLAQDYTAMSHSVDLINGIIDGTQMADESTEDKQDAVRRNKEHLELMVAKEDWGSEDMTSANSAIASATTYLG